MKSENKKALLAKREEVTQKLIVQGVPYHQARFMVMSAGANPEGILADQPTGEGMDPELVKITNQAREERKIEVAETAIIHEANVQAALGRLQDGQATNEDFNLLASSGYGYIEDDEFAPSRFVFAPGDNYPNQSKKELWT